MSEYNTQSTTYTAGYVTAYGAAKRGGYTGTYEEFCAAIAGMAVTVEDLENFSVVINTLSPGSSATASYANGVLTLGVPQGAKGDKGDKGDTGEVSQAELDEAIGQIKNDLSELEHTYSAFVVETESGSVASFSDGADDVPVKDLQVAIEPVQSGSGDPSPDNVRPISGWTGVNVTRTGKNLCYADASHLFPRGDGLTIVTDETLFTAYAKIPKNTDIVFSCVSKPSRYSAFGFSEEPAVGVICHAISITTLSQTAYKMNSGDYEYIGFYYGPNEVANIMIEVGSTGSTYEPYQGETYEVDWTTEAGTVYGGTLDVTTGVLTVDRAYKNVALSNFEYNVSINCLLGYSSYNTFADAKAPANNNTKFNAVADAIGINSAGAINGGSDGLGITATKDVYLRSSGLTSKAEYLTAFPNGINVVYELATPQTYQLTPHEVSTILGQNNIFADTGNVTVQYRADTKLYIDKVLSA